MTATRLKQSLVNLINQIDDKDTALLNKVYLFLTANVPAKKEEKGGAKGEGKKKDKGQKKEKGKKQ